MRALAAMPCAASRARWVLTRKWRGTSTIGMPSTDQMPVASSTSMGTSGFAMSAAPRIGEEAEPVAADDPADAGLGPAALLHRRGQVGKVADRPQPGGIDYLAELDDQPALALLAADVL